ncbi:MAG: TetR/AcrR family transcriptional regulator [Pseudomonadota bacterium]
MSEAKRNPRRGYHHGNLREALVAAALDLIARKGPAGLTIAEAARAAGVSAAAPYRHFRDRDALLADVAERGFQSLRDRLERAWNDARPEPVAAFRNTGFAYLAFAREEPAAYAAMFESGLTHSEHPDLARAADSAFDVLRRATEAVVASLPEEDRPPVGMMNFHIWGLSHGIADLFARGDGARRSLPMTPEELLEAGVLIYLRGLGVMGERP